MKRGFIGKSATIWGQMTPTNQRIRDILRRLGLTEKQANAVLPHGVDSNEGYPVGMMTDAQNDGKTWAQREYEKDNRGFRPIR